MTQKPWVDVSHILGWSGRLTGIERVEYHLIKHYFENTDAGFIGWDKSNGAFEEINRNYVKDKIIDRTSEQELTGNKLKPVPKLARLKQRLLKPTKRKWQGKGPVIVLAGLWDNKPYINALVELSKTNPLIHVIYDMIPVVKPEFVVDFLPGVFADYMFNVLPRCRAILAISEATRKDVVKLLKEKSLPVPDSMTFRLGDDLARARRAQPPTNIQGDFILSAGTIEARKNHKLLYDAYKTAAKRGDDLPQLMIAGKRGWLTEDLQRLIEQDPDVNKKIIIIDNATDGQMRWLYENCLFTVFPSLYEGWGLPVAESLDYGKVTLASNRSSIPEVGGDNVDYFSPDSSAQLLGLIKHYMNSTERDKREAYIRDHYQQTAWDEASADFAAAVSKILD